MNNAVLALARHGPIHRERRLMGAHSQLTVLARVLLTVSLPVGSASLANREGGR